jgi:two-component system alkaline phosphatase synthesis response regulator PhoP
MEQKTILLVEDDQILVKMYQRKFEKEGFKVLSAFDGEEGLNTLKSAQPKPSIILLDVMLPKINGFAVLEKVKKEANFKDIPVILLTNLGGAQEDREKGKNLGAVDYLVKSDLTPNQVVEKVKEYIK